MIPLSEAAILYCTNERNILNWAKQNKITTSRIGGTLMIDETSLSRIIELNAKISHYDEYLENIVEIKEKELSNVILQINDIIFLFQSIKKTTPLLRALINETALLIPDEFKRNIYKETTLSMKLSDVAQKYNITNEKARYIYDSAIKCINDNLGFILEYRNTLELKDLKIKKLEIAVRNQEEVIENLSILLRCYADKPYKTPTPVKYIPYKDLMILSMSLETDFNLEFRTVNCLRAIDINTIEDLLRFVRDNGAESLLNMRNFGVKSLVQLRSTLVESDIIDSEWKSYLFEYL